MDEVTFMKKAYSELVIYRQRQARTLGEVTKNFHINIIERVLSEGVKSFWSLELLSNYVSIMEGSMGTCVMTDEFHHHGLCY